MQLSDGFCAGETFAIKKIIPQSSYFFQDRREIKNSSYQDPYALISAPTLLCIDFFL